MNKISTVELKIGGRIVRVPVDAALQTNFLNKFKRGAPTELQQNRYKTLMNLMVAAYLHLPVRNEAMMER